ncbi:MAG: PQQ-binding-like beta-propeller repeat protein [Candidatus Brocadiia bacterium]
MRSVEYGADPRPARFDANAAEQLSGRTPRVRPWRRVRLNPEWAGAWNLVEDVDGDGELEVVSARNVNENDVHYTCSVIVHRLDGSVLWRWGAPSVGRNNLHHDVACQVHDWDADGKPEVVLAAGERLVALDGATGEEVRSFPIPSEGSDCLAFVDLTGTGHRREVIVKTRYGRIWAYALDGELLWTVERPAGYRTSHQVRPIDIDGDGRDELVAGYALLNPDGSVRWTFEHEDVPIGKGHLDAVRVLRPGATAQETLLVATFCGDERMAVVTGTGDYVWTASGRHFESVDIGQIYPDLSEPQILVDIAHSPELHSPLWVMSFEGELLGRFETNRSRRHALIDWLGRPDELQIVTAHPPAIFDGEGRALAALETGASPIERGQVFAADLTGDGVRDILWFDNPADTVFLYRNETGQPQDPPGSPGTGPNFTLY